VKFVSALPVEKSGGRRWRYATRRLPLKKAMGMMLTGRHVSAQESYQAGLCHG